MGRASLFDDLAKLVQSDVHVLETGFQILMRVFTIIAFDQRNTFVARDIPVANLLRCVICRSSKTELGVCCVVVQPIDLIIQRGIFAVTAFGAMEVWQKTGILDREVIGLLRVPF